MDYYTILVQRTILSGQFAGRMIETVKISNKYNVFLVFEGDRAVKLSCVPDMPYLQIIEKKFVPRKKAIFWHNSFFSGRKLEDVRITHGDRVIAFDFDSGVRLIFEMTGRHANIIAVGGDGAVAGAVRKVTSKESGIREIKSGTPYISPPARDFPDLVWLPFPALVRQLGSSDETVADTVRKQFCAGSRYFAFEALARANIDPNMQAANVDPESVAVLAKTMAELASVIENGGNGATLLIGGDSLPRDVFPVKMTVSDISMEHEETLGDAVREYARGREIGLDVKSIRNFILGVLNREEKSIRSTIGKVEREKGSETDPQDLEHKGNTILANVHVLEKGMKSAELDDPYGTEKMVIELDPTLDGPSNASRYFKRAKKIRAAAKLASGRLSGLRERLDFIAEERGNAAETDDIKTLKVIAEAYKRKQFPSSDPTEDERFPRRFISVSGLEIIVGRNDRENDELLRWANKNDLWLHAQNIGGSHVILRSPGKQSPDHQSVARAASIAAYFSKGKTSAIVPVVCTQLKYVVKRKGQGPGKVTYTREKVLFVEPALPKHSI
ncbi:NFACT family protein [Candidatus Latescibacterota bacterium]